MICHLLHADSNMENPEILIYPVINNKSLMKKHADFMSFFFRCIKYDDTFLQSTGSNFEIFDIKIPLFYPYKCPEIRLYNVSHLHPCITL